MAIQNRAVGAGHWGDDTGWISYHRISLVAVDSTFRLSLIVASVLHRYHISHIPELILICGQEGKKNSRRKHVQEKCRRRVGNRKDDAPKSWFSYRLSSLLSPSVSVSFFSRRVSTCPICLCLSKAPLSLYLAGWKSKSRSTACLGHGSSPIADTHPPRTNQVRDKKMLERRVEKKWIS